MVAWDPQCLAVDVLQTSDQMVCAKVQIVASSKFFYLSIVYGSNSFVERRRLWAEMRVFNSVCGDSPWIMVGDYNIVRARAERLEEFDSNAVGDFNNCLEDLEMEDLPTKGFWFSWSNKRGGLGDNKSKLDRALINPSWLDEFPNAEAVLLAPGVSDHCSLIVTIMPELRCKKPFKFFNFWMKQSSFKDSLAQSWAEPVEGSSMMLRFSLKLRRLKFVLKDLNLRCFSNICSRVAQAREELSQVQSLCFSNPFDATLCAKEKEVLRTEDLYGA